MVRFKPENFCQAEWDSAAAAFCGHNLMQDWAYGAAKAQVGGWRVERGMLSDAANVCGAAQVLLKSLPVIGGGVAWVNRGPVGLSRSDRGTLLQALHQYYVVERGYYLRIAPAMHEEALTGMALDKYGFRLTDTTGWASAVLDLATDLEALRAALRQNWRNALNKAERRDPSIEVAAGGAAFEGFLAEYADFLRHRHIRTTVTADLLRALQAQRSAGQTLQCYRARHQKTQLGSVLVVRSGKTVEYLAGTLLDAGRSFSVGQLLLWRAIRDAKSSGARYFDLGGLDPDRTPKGIFDFKSGVAGLPYRLAPEIESIDGGIRAAIVRCGVLLLRKGGAS